MFTSPLPVTRNHLIQETKLAYGSILSALKRGWSHSAKKTFADFYTHRDDLTVSPDGVLSLDDRPIIPPTCREAMLQHLHSGHMGRDKMKSLARLLCWWPSINSDIINYVRHCERCNKKPSSHSQLSAWPLTYQPMQRVHADYCGPFLGRHYALVVEDSYSKFPEVFFTTHATAGFTKEALQKFFAREGIAQVLVTDNGSHFTEENLNLWLKNIGCSHVYTAPRHPQSNGLAERFVRTLKTAISASGAVDFPALSVFVDNFLLQYRNAAHATTGKTPAMLFKGRNLRSSSALDTTEVLFYKGNDNRPAHGVIIQKLGKRMVQILDVSDCSIHRRHVDQIHISAPQPVTQQQMHPVPQMPAPPETVTTLPQHNLAESSPPSELQPLPVAEAAPPQPDAPLQQPAPANDEQAAADDLDATLPCTEDQPPLRRSQRTRRKPSRFGDGEECGR